MEEGIKGLHDQFNHPSLFLVVGVGAFVAEFLKRKDAEVLRAQQKKKKGGGKAK